MTAKTSLLLLGLFTATLGVLRSDLSLKSGPPKTEIGFWNGFTGPDGTTMLGLVERFNQENPDAHVTMQRIEWATYYNKLMVAALDGRGPEVYVLQGNSIPRMKRAGFVADVSSLYHGPDGIPESDFDSVVQEQIHYGSESAGVPLDVWPQGLYYNKDSLKKAGLVDAAGNPKPPTTGEEFVAAMKAMNKPTDDGQKTWGYALTLWRNNFMVLVPQFGGHYFDKNGNADLTTPGNTQALEWLGNLTKQKIVPPPENGLGWTGYRQGKVAMVWEGVYMLGDLKSLKDFPYAAAPVPQIGPIQGTFGDSHFLCIRKGISPEKRDAAERFIKFLSKNSITWADAGQVPARKSVRANPLFKQMPVQQQFAKMVPYVMYPPKTPIQFELGLELDLAVEKVMRGRATAKEALEVANKNVQRFVDRDNASKNFKAGAQ